MFPPFVLPLSFLGSSDHLRRLIFPFLPPISPTQQVAWVTVQHKKVQTQVPTLHLNCAQENRVDIRLMLDAVSSEVTGGASQRGKKHLTEARYAEEKKKNASALVISLQQT